MRWKPSTVFDDPPVELTRAELRRGQRAAQRAAVAAQKSLTLTKRRQYRRYRATAGDKYLDWPQWKTEYLRVYKRGITVEPAGGGTSGAASLSSGGLGP